MSSTYASTQQQLHARKLKLLSNMALRSVMTWHALCCTLAVKASISALKAVCCYSFNSTTVAFQC